MIRNAGRDLAMPIAAVSISCATLYSLFYIVPTRLAVAACVTLLCACLPRSGQVILYVGLIAFTGLIRRITAGADGYVAGDPLVLLPVLPAVFIAARSTWGNRFRGPLLGLVSAYLGLSFFMSALRLTSQPILIVSGLLGLVSTFTVGWALASEPKLAATARGTAIVAGTSSAAYAFYQYYHPPTYDLAWLSTQLSSGSLISVGKPMAEQFRPWSTLESPGVFASFLGIVVLMILFPPGHGRSRYLRWVELTALPVICAALLLSQVRTAIYGLILAIVLCLLLVVLRSSPVVALTGSAFALSGIFAISRLVNLFGEDSTIASNSQRLVVGNLTTDDSFVARSTELARFFSEGLHLVGGGVGVASEGTATTDNGYIVTASEGGVLLLLALVAIVVWTLTANALPPAKPMAFSLVAYFFLAQASGPIIQSSLAFAFWWPVLATRGQLDLTKGNDEYPRVGNYLGQERARFDIPRG